MSLSCTLASYLCNRPFPNYLPPVSKAKGNLESQASLVPILSYHRKMIFHSHSVKFVFVFELVLSTSHVMCLNLPKNILGHQKKIMHDLKARRTFYDPEICPSLQHDSTRSQLLITRRLIGLPVLQYFFFLA